jgi:hypothetical protein
MEELVLSNSKRTGPMSRQPSGLLAPTLTSGLSALAITSSCFFGLVPHDRDKSACWLIGVC